MSGKVCAFCKKSFFDKTRNRNKKYCSTKCYFEANKANQYKRNKAYKLKHEVALPTDDVFRNSYQKTVAIRIPKNWFRQIIAAETRREIKHFLKEQRNLKRQKGETRK